MSGASYAEFPRLSILIIMSRMLKSLLVSRLGATPDSTLLAAIHSVKQKLPAATSHALFNFAYCRNSYLPNDHKACTPESIHRLETLATELSFALLALPGINEEDVKFLDWRSTPALVLDTSKCTGNLAEFIDEDPVQFFVGAVVTIETLLADAFQDELRERQPEKASRSLALMLALLQPELPRDLIASLKWANALRNQLFYEESCAVSNEATLRLMELESAVTRFCMDHSLSRLQASAQDFKAILAKKYVTPKEDPCA